MEFGLREIGWMDYQKIQDIQIWRLNECKSSI